MNQTYKDILTAHFPTMFRKHWSYPSCGDGWYGLLFQLCYDIQQTNPPADFEIAQVKEKFGYLRFYVYNSTNAINELIHKAEAKSEVTCEECGKFGTIRKTRSWWQTLCDECEAYKARK